MDDPLDASAAQDGIPLECEGDTVLDFLEMVIQQFMAKVPRRSVDGPRLAFLLVKPNT